MSFKHIGPLTLLAAATALQAQVVCVNCPAGFSAGLPVSGKTLDDSFRGARLVVLESGGTAMTADREELLESFVRRGGSLLRALDQRPGITPFSLSFLLPTTAWRVNSNLAAGTGPDGAIRCAEWDREMFSGDEPKGLVLPFHIGIRPFDAVERGEGRYEMYARTLPYVKTNVAAGNTFWTRPLLNRSCRVRLRGEGAEQIPLLITGQYGAGRVAVFAPSLASGAPPFWIAVMKWLNSASRPPEASPYQIGPYQIGPPVVGVDTDAHFILMTVAMARFASPEQAASHASQIAAAAGLSAGKGVWTGAQPSYAGGTYAGDSDSAGPLTLWQCEAWVLMATLPIKPFNFQQSAAISRTRQGQ